MTPSRGPTKGPREGGMSFEPRAAHLSVESFSGGTTSALVFGSSSIVVVSNDTGSTTGRVATLTLVNSPVITTQPLSQSVPQNSPASMGVIAVGDAPLNFQWLRNSNAIAGATATNFVQHLH